MKKFLMTFVVLVCVVVTASAQTVYVSTGDGAVAYHKSKTCSYLSNSKNVKSMTATEAKKLGRHECARCYGAAAASSAKKTVTKKADETKKKADKKVAPARDEKGRFVKKAETEKKAATKKAADTKKKADEAKKKADDAKKKASPARDEKGRFIKKAA